MDNQRGIAIIIAMFAAILVMLAGKSCADSMNRNKKADRNASGASKVSGVMQTNTTLSSDEVNEYTVTANTTVQTEDIEYITDILGRVIGTAEPSSHPQTEAATEPQIEYVTDILGRVVKVIEPETQTSTEDPTAETVHKNPLEEYYEQHPEMTKPTKSDDEEEHYKAPSSVYITIG